MAEMSQSLVCALKVSPGQVRKLAMLAGWMEQAEERSYRILQ